MRTNRKGKITETDRERNDQEKQHRFRFGEIDFALYFERYGVPSARSPLRQRDIFHPLSPNRGKNKGKKKKKKRKRREGVREGRMKPPNKTYYSDRLFTVPCRSVLEKPYKHVFCSARTSKPSFSHARNGGNVE